MLVAQGKGGVRLEAVDEIAVVDVARNASKEEVLHRIRTEIEVGVAGKNGHLERYLLGGFLIGGDGIIVLLVLVFVDRGRVGRRIPL